MMCNPYEIKFEAAYARHSPRSTFSRAAHRNAANSFSNRMVKAPHAKIVAFFDSLNRAFGRKYVATLIIVYGINQGVGQSLVESAMDYYLVDDLRLSTATAERLRGFARIPWQLKSLFGVLSDLVPINGLHRSPYVLAGAVLGVSGTFSLLISPPGTYPPFIAIAMLMCNMNNAIPDVMIDATVAERSRVRPDLTANLQALCWCSLYAFSIPVFAISGYIISKVGPRINIGGAIATAAAVGVPALLGWLGEKRRPGRPGLMGFFESLSQRTKYICSTPNKKNVIKSASVVGAFSVSLGAIQLLAGESSPLFVAIYNVLGACIITVTLYIVLRRIDEALARAVVFTFIKQALCPRSRVLMFDWSHEPSTGDTDWRCFEASECTAALDFATTFSHGGSNSSNTSEILSFMDEEAYGDLHKLVEIGGLIYRTVNGSDSNVTSGLECGWATRRSLPCLSPVLRSWVAVVGYVAGFLGTMLYASLFQSWPFRRIIGMCQLLLVLANFLDVIWIYRLNVHFGIRDEVFAFGEEAFVDVIDQIQSQAFFIFAVKLCPRDVEASMFALFMGLSNFGYDVGRYAGTAVMSLLGGVSAPGYDGIGAFMWVKTLSRLLPLLSVPFLVPSGRPSDSAVGLGVELSEVTPKLGDAPEALGA